MPQLVQKKLEDRREGLIAFIERYQPQGSWKNSVTIVFDGKSDVYSLPSGARWGVKVIFSRDETADEKIKCLVQQSQTKKSIVVVTDDRDIKYHVRALGAIPMSVKDFLAKMAEPAYRTGRPKSMAVESKTKDKVPAETKRISKTLEQKITNEMAEIWLGKKRGNG